MFRFLSEKHIFPTNRMKLFTLLFTLVIACCFSVNCSVRHGLKMEAGKGNRMVYTPETDWVMINDDHGVPTLAILTGPSPPQKAIDFPASVRFHLWTKSNPTTDQRLFVDDEASLSASSFNPAHPTKILIHGYTNTLASPIIQDSRTAYMSVAGEYNVIGVDWGDLAAGPLYNVAKGRVVVVGEYVAKMVDFLMVKGGARLADIHITGHSLGAHVAANAGSRIRAGLPSRVTGLDPALPLFLDDDDSTRIDPTDAEYVDVIHTCGGSLGFREPRGMADFYPNGGVVVQPGCGLIDLTGSCSHAKAHDLWALSIVDGADLLAHPCLTQEDAEAGACSLSTAGLMGEASDHGMRGMFYLKTK